VAKIIWQKLHRITSPHDGRTPRISTTTVCISCIRCSPKVIKFTSQTSCNTGLPTCTLIVECKSYVQTCSRDGQRSLTTCDSSPTTSDQSRQTSTAFRDRVTAMSSRALQFARQGETADCVSASPRLPAALCSTSSANSSGAH